MKKVFIISGAVLLIAAGVVYYLFFMKNLKDRIVLPYIAHQKPHIDPHLPHSVPMADKLSEVVFDGLFNVSANASGITYEDGLGEYMGISPECVVSVRLKPKRTWHSSFRASMEKEKIELHREAPVIFMAKDLKFTLRRIQHLGSMSPDYILVSQAIQDFDFSGPDENNEIKLQFRQDRIWSESDIKEVLSFKILPANSEMDAPEYIIGSGPYLKAGEYKENLFFPKNPDGMAQIGLLLLKPFIDNSTYTTELRNKNINVLLSTPFGAVSPILGDSSDYFVKSSISTCFFALFYNTQRLNLDQRKVLRRLVDNKKILVRFFKIGTAQQRHIINYKGDNDNYGEYLNYSVFPTTSYYVEEKIVSPLHGDSIQPDLSLLPDTVRIKTCVNYDFREELSELASILNDPEVSKGKIKVTAVQNEEIRRGDYDAVLLPITGYRSNFLFDLYSIFLREPDLALNRINLQTLVDAQGVTSADEKSLSAAHNFFRMDLAGDSPDRTGFKQLLDDCYGFMSTSEIGDKQEYARRIDALEQDLALGSWLFSLPSLAYFSAQFDAKTVDLYGIASQLSTIEKWQESLKK